MDGYYHSLLPSVSLQKTTPHLGVSKAGCSLEHPRQGFKCKIPEGAAPGAQRESSRRGERSGEA